MFYAAWLGLFLTGINLLPVGQLDGGHAAYALLGRYSHIVAYITFFLLIVAGMLVLSWLERFVYTEEAGGSSPSAPRREFLYYIWTASLALFAVQFTGLLVWFMLPRFREGEFGGTFTLPIDTLPDVNAPPFNFPDGRFWLVNLNDENPNELMFEAPGDGTIIGAAAIYKVCTHLGCIYAWTPANGRFECPCHGSKYRLDGRRIEAPARAIWTALTYSRWTRMKMSSPLLK